MLEFFNFKDLLKRLSVCIGFLRGLIVMTCS